MHVYHSLTSCSEGSPEDHEKQSGDDDDLASIKRAFNSAMCKIYKVKPQQLDDIYNYTCQLDIVDVIMRRHRKLFV